MIQNSKITISTIQFDVDPDEVITISCPAEYFFHNGKHYVKYIETPEGGDSSEQSIETMIKVDGDNVEVRKKGLVQTQMRYSSGGKNTAYYDSPAGRLLMDIETDRVKIVENDTMVKVIMGYRLSLNKEFLSKCRMTIVVEKKYDDNTY